MDLYRHYSVSVDEKNMASHLESTLFGDTTCL